MNGSGAEVMAGEAAAATAAAAAAATPTAHPRGIKRTQGEALDDDQRFTKRFNLLKIDSNNNHAKLYISGSSRPQQPLRTAPPQNDHMQLDDSKDRVYIHSLDDELADIESDEEKLVFLPDIEKRLSKIPKHLLTGTREQSNEGQELVLYTVPSSISVPLEKDSVRKAILESRQRAREKVQNSVVHDNISHVPDNPETAHGLDAAHYFVPDDQEDVDAMDMT